MDDAAPEVVVSASCGVEGKRVIAYKPRKSVILQRPQGLAELGPDDLGWATLVAAASPADCVASGTTGNPKGVVRGCGGYAVALRWSMGTVYDMGPGETMFTGSDARTSSTGPCSPAPPCCTRASRSAPRTRAFWRVASEHRAKTMFTAPTTFRAIRKENPEGTLTADYDLTGLRYLLLADERLAPETYHWASDLLGIPVIDHWWQTETGWPIVANPVGIEAAPVKPGSPTRPLRRRRMRRHRRRRRPEGQVPHGFVVLKAGISRDATEVEVELVQLVRTCIGAVAALKDIAVVAALPKTRSGKTMRGIADGRDKPIPSTVGNPGVIETLRPVLRRDRHTP
ncbi:AMP-binding protein [Streptomyces acidiscabies]|nr:AMP-binding protein [Streptomyces acidiscabies]